jgi:hypothetical protein
MLERQDNVREPEVNAGGEKRRQRMVPKMPLDYRGIDPRAFRAQHQRYVGAYPIHVDLPVPDSQKRKGVTRQADKVKRGVPPSGYTYSPSSEGRDRK